MKFSTVMFVALSSIVSANLFWGSSDENTSSSGFLGLGEGSSGSSSTTPNSSSLGESMGGNGSGSDGVQKAKEEVAGFMGKDDGTSAGFFGSSSGTTASGKSGLAESESSCDEGECSGGSSNPPSSGSANFWGKGDKDE
ncbi:hypothetical protein KMI_03g05060 [Encephalitozoon hellem]|nr:hypothetical protein KMI_03g05060 [Encephalitozoon hellem]